MREHSVERCFGERVNIRESIEEAAEVGDHGRDLGLLEHDL